MKKRIKELIKIINQANQDYYILDNPKLSDKQYDQYLKELETLEKEYPQFKQKNSPTEKINVKTNTPFSKINHKSPMLSLSNAFDYEQLEQFDQKIKKQITDFEYICELKIDGLAVSLEYQNGILTKAATRGDGFIGEDITNNVKTIKSIPLTLKEKLNLEVRGEIYMSKETFLKLNEQRQKNNESLFANPRNAAAGSVRQLDSNITANRNLDCFIYYGNLKKETHYQILTNLKMLGFNINPFVGKKNNLKQVITYIEEWEQKRENLSYETDGIVIKINNLKQQLLLGITAKSPKWAIAYKYKPIEEITKINDIIFTVGRTGQVTPNAVLEPVSIDGSLVSRTTLHNENNIKEKDIRIGDYAVVRKAGDIIPEVVKVIAEKRENTLPFKMIEQCPICKSKLAKIEAAHYCLNQNCEARIQESLVHFSSRGAQNIEGLGERIIEIFYNEGLLKKIEDFYLLKNYRNQLINLSGFGEKSIDKILEQVEKSKTNNLDKLIFSLGIKHVGSKKAKVLAESFFNLNNLKKATINELIEIEDVGYKIAESVVNYFKENESLILFLEKEKVNFEYHSTKKENQKFNQKVFVITGGFEKYTREEIKERLENMGAKVTNKVTKKTDVLICGDKPGSKLDEAKKLNILIWNLDELEKKLKT